MTKTITFTPSEPIEFKGKTYATLTFRKLKAKDLCASDMVKGETAKGFAIFASMADVPLPVIHELDADDIERLGEEIAPLMGNGFRKAAAEVADAETTAAATP